MGLFFLFVAVPVAARPAGPADPARREEARRELGKQSRARKRSRR